MSKQARKTPVEDLLQAVPLGAKIWSETRDEETGRVVAHHQHPVGRLAMEARTEILRLRAENERLRKALETIRDMDTGPDKLAQSVADYELSGKVAPT